MMTVDEKINYLNQLGVHFDSNTLNIGYSQNTYAKNCPKLFYDKLTNEFALFYQSPNNNEMGQQAFYFNELHFLEAYNEKKYKNYRYNYLFCFMVYFIVYINFYDFFYNCSIIL